MAIPKGPDTVTAQQLIRKSPQQGWVELVLQYGNSHMGQTGLATCDPELVQELLMDRTHTLKRSGIYTFTSWLVPGAPGVLFMDGKKWQQHLAAVMPVFTKANIDTYSKTIHDTVTEYMQQQKHLQEMDDLYLFITQLGLRVVSKVGYGLNPDDPKAAAYGKELMEYKLQTMTSSVRLDDIAITPKQIWVIPSLLRFLYKLGKMMKRQRKMVAGILANRSAADKEKLDWMNLLAKTGMPLKDITNELNHIYGAFNAIDYTVTCAFYELARNPEWIEILRQEFKKVLGEKPYPDREDIVQLKNCSNFIKEIYRYYPVAIAVLRKTGKPLNVQGTIYPKNKEVMILIQSMHHHPSFWKDPAIFNPHRWNEPLLEPKAFIPFLTGPRQCIGKHLAELHFIITLHAILKDWNVVVHHKNVPIVPYIIPRFSEAIPARIEKVMNN